MLEIIFLLLSQIFKGQALSRINGNSIWPFNPFTFSHNMILSFLLYDRKTEKMDVKDCVQLRHSIAQESFNQQLPRGKKQFL